MSTLGVKSMLHGESVSITLGVRARACGPRSPGSKYRDKKKEKRRWSVEQKVRRGGARAQGNLGALRAPRSWCWG